MNLDAWARKWQIPQVAIAELKQALGVEACPAPQGVARSEAAVVSDLRLEAAQKGGVLWRNNVGAAFDVNGNFIRYGLCNESTRINKRFKSSDLIGIMPVTIDQSMVGKTIGQFVARETKRSDWKYRGTEREKAQLRFLHLVLSMGGDASFATEKGTL